MTASAELEVELKLDVDAMHFDALVGAPIFAGVALVAKPQVSTYYDTPDRALREAGVSLRVRRTGTRHVQTIKAQGRATAGLFARPEWECEVPGDAPVIDDVAGPLASLLHEAVLEAIEAAFSVEVVRQTGIVHYADAQIEVMLDRGTVHAGDRQAPLAEVELELRSGPRAALFALARLLNETAPLRLGVMTKAERGYRLVARSPDKPVKGAPATLAEEMTPAQVFQAIAGACLRQYRLNEALFLRTQAAEALHQARVALRRLRSAISIFRPILMDERVAHLRQELRWLAAALGEARDFDVLRARGYGSDDAALKAGHARAYTALEEVLASDRTRGLLIDLAEWVAIGMWQAAAADEGSERTAGAFAAHTLDRLRRRLKREGRRLARLSDEDRHEVRIVAKKLRYATEFFADLFTGKKAARRQRTFRRALQALQEHLGDLNDIATAPVLLAQLGITPVEDPTAADRREALLADAEEAHESLIDAKRFW